VFLKELQIKGFKSFADTATLRLEPGVTVVVGPNGSGKSNVVDAIGWVLGAQAPSAVRSQKMDDVIFAGTQKRPALGRAEVALTIDNSSGMLPIDFTEVTISRTLFRSGDSEYAINGAECRLLDIQELLSDSGVGRQQHVIISQGQIDAVLNSRPEDRRLIIEEAAGVLKFRKRKEKAERRLTATEANLTRISDLLREVRRQLRPLERQADAARRHGDVIAELATLRIHLIGRDLFRLRGRLTDSNSAQNELRTEERRIRSELSRLDAEVLAAEARLSAMGGPDFSDGLVRTEALRERAHGLDAVLIERARNLERERTAFIDQTVVASLETEATQVRADLDRPDHRATVDAEMQASEQELVDHRGRFDAEWADGVDGAAAELVEVRAELTGLRRSTEQAEGDRQRLDEADARQRSRSAALAAAGAAALTELETLAADRERVESVDEQSQTSLTAAGVLVEQTETELAVAAEHLHRSEARAAALAAALDEARRRSGADLVATVDGVVGSLLDVVSIDAGWESAVEAAAATAMYAVVVADPAAARHVVELLAAGDATATVLAAGPGPVVLPAPVGQAVRSHVRGATPAVDGLLDRVIASAARVEGGWSQAVDAAMAFPDAVFVTDAGDRFGPDGWVVGLQTTGSTGAALTEASETAAAAALTMGSVKGRLDEARESLAAVQAVAVAASDRRSASSLRIELLTADAERAARDTEAVSADMTEAAGHRTALTARLTRDLARTDQLTARLAELEHIEASRSVREVALVVARAELDQQMATVATLRSRHASERAARDERKRALTERLTVLETRLARHADERSAAAQRREELEARSEVVHTLAGVVADRFGEIDALLAVLRAARDRHSERTREVGAGLDAARQARQQSEKELEAARERLQRAEIGDAEITLRLEAATETCRRELDCEPDTAITTPVPLLPDGATPSSRARDLERDIRLMGPINPLALEEFAALSERATLLETQVEDVRSARRELGKVIRAVDEEIVSVFAAAFADVSENFVHLFDTLFPGGHGALKLTEPHDLLATGIEIEAKPSGKNVKKLSLLSGGERSLTALAFLFAVFRSRPSPFYIMDEVEAALDDVNLHRFLGLVAEFRSSAQLVIVSHQKRTMEAADVLYGVTMEPGGSSRVLSERVSATLD